MSSAVPPDRGPDTEPIQKVGSTERTRAALVLGVIAVVAVLVVGIMVYTMGSSDKATNTTPAANSRSGPAVTVTGGAPTSTSARPTPSRASARPSVKPSSSTHARTGPVSCPSAAPCALPDDVGNALQAVNSYRSAHGRGAVTGSVTKPAQQCALQNGDGNACPSGYYWEPVGRSGDEVVSKIAKSGKGVGWLLDPKFTKLQIGWVYLPSSKSFECVLVSNA